MNTVPVSIDRRWKLRRGICLSPDKNTNPCRRGRDVGEENLLFLGRGDQEESIGVGVHFEGITLGLGQEEEFRADDGDATATIITQ